MDRLTHEDHSYITHDTNWSTDRQRDRQMDEEGQMYIPTLKVIGGIKKHIVNFGPIFIIFCVMFTAQKIFKVNLKKQVDRAPS